MKFTLNNFLSKINKYSFKIKDGVCVLPFLANSPKLIFESMIGLPFTKYNDAMKCHSAKNMFVTGDSYFYELEEGLWVYYSALNNKVSFEHKLFYDDKLPAEYYVLSYNIVTREDNKNFALVNGISFNNYSWNVLKPKSVSSVIYFKGTKIKTMGLYINETWIKKKLVHQNGYSNSNFETFMSGLVKKNIWQEYQHENHKINGALEKIVLLADSNERKLALQEWANSFINLLISNYPTNHHLQTASNYNADVHRKMAKVENSLMKNLLGVFPGIDVLAEDVNISPTKLKTDFKNFYGEPIYQYYLNKKLDYAATLLKAQQFKIKEIASILNYGNEGNFTRAFKTRFNKLPSDVRELKSS